MIIEKHFSNAKIEESALSYLKFMFDEILPEIREAHQWHHYTDIEVIKEYGQAKFMEEVIKDSLASAFYFIEEVKTSPEQIEYFNEFIKVLTNNWTYVDTNYNVLNFNSLFLEKFYNKLFHSGINIEFKRGAKLSLKQRLEQLTKRDDTDEVQEADDESTDEEKDTENEIERWQRDSVKESSWSSMCKIR
jgi:hypothetical protein